MPETKSHPYYGGDVTWSLPCGCLGEFTLDPASAETCDHPCHWAFRFMHGAAA